MKYRLLFAIAILIMPKAKAQSTLPRLLVSTNGRFLVQENQAEKPFFWLGDTAWDLFAGLNDKEALHYLDDRSNKKFSVVQAHLLPWEFTKPNVLGQKAFLNNDFDQPNEAYWQHVDFIIEQASQRGLYLALLPAWCNAYIEPEKAPLHSDSLKAQRYGHFLGKRYRNFSNLIWVLGGDKLPKCISIYRHLAKGLTDTYGDGDANRILMTYHPPGGTWRPPATSSGEFFHNETWLDFNMIQSGHAIDNANYERITEDYFRKPIKPTLDAEPCYEQHPVKHDYQKGTFSAWDVRRRGYWSVLAGACGFTYGGNGIWQMDKPDRIGQKTHFKDYWYDALHYEGGTQMQHLRKFAETYQWTTWIPDSTLLNSPIGRTDDRVQSVRTVGGDHFFHYITNGRTIALKALPLGKWFYAWFDPRTGTLSRQKKVKSVIFSAPPNGIGADWVLVVSK
jgi:hypothetical protein